MKEQTKEYLLEKIESANQRLRGLKMQGEGSSGKTLKSIRTRRNRAIKELIKLLTPETSYASEIEKQQLKGL